jgi:hypothetical protein
MQAIKSYIVAVERGLKAQMAKYSRKSQYYKMQMKIPLDEITMKDIFTEKPGRHIHMIDSMAMLGFPDFLKESEKPR